MDQKIVLISGKQGSGKSTVQKELVRQLCSRPDTWADAINFADPIYEIHNFALALLKRFGIDRDIVKDGPLLQLLGTEWGRKTINEGVWVNALLGRMNYLLTERTLAGRTFKDNFFIVGDCRFKNELLYGSHVVWVRLECPRELRKLRCSMWRENENHPSETDLDAHSADGKFDLYFDTTEKNLEGAIARDIIDFFETTERPRRGPHYN